MDCNEINDLLEVFLSFRNLVGFTLSIEKTIEISRKLSKFLPVLALSLILLIQNTNLALLRSYVFFVFIGVPGRLDRQVHVKILLGYAFVVHFEPVFVRQKGVTLVLMVHHEVLHLLPALSDK
jgi:hypothetical protein